MKKIQFILIISTTLFHFSRFSDAEIYALLVGINDYQNIKALKYCESDVALFQESLIRYVGVKKVNCKVILGSDATKAGIVAGFDWLANQIQPDDRLIFYFSGHGAQARDLEGDEADQRDEVLCTYDIIPGERHTYLLDDQFSEILDKVNTEDKIVILDCCHSGTGTRFQPREVRQKTIHLEELPSQSTKDLTLVSTNNDNTVLLSACSAEQVALETEKHQHGLLTYYLTKHLHTSPAQKTKGISFRELHEKVLAEIHINGYNQTPQLEGNAKNRDFVLPDSGVTFHGEVISLDRGLENPQNQSILISLGHEDGVTEGSVYTVYASLDDIANGTPKGEIVITNVGQSESAARLENDKRLVIEPGDKIVESEQKHNDQQLLIALGEIQSEDPQTATRLREVLSEFSVSAPSVRLVTDKSLADGVILLEVSKQTEGERGPRFRQKKNIPGTQGVKITLVDLKMGEIEQTFSGSLSGNPTQSETRQALTPPLEALRQKLKFNQAVKILANLQNRNSDFEVKVSVDKGRGATYTLGDTIKYYVEASENCYVMLIAITAGEETYLLYPNEMQSDHFVTAGQRFVIPPEDMDAEIVLEPPPGVEIIKAIATRNRLGLESMEVLELIKQLDSSIAKSSESKRGPKFKKKSGWAVDTAVYFVVE
jgi:hypothetical protein